MVPCIPDADVVTAFIKDWFLELRSSQKDILTPFILADRYEIDSCQGVYLLRQAERSGVIAKRVNEAPYRYNLALYNSDSPNALEPISIVSDPEAKYPYWLRIEHDDNRIHVIELGELHTLPQAVSKAYDMGYSPRRWVSNGYANIIPSSIRRH